MIAIGLFVIVLSLAGIVGILQRNQKPPVLPTVPPGKKLSPSEERVLIQQVFGASEKKTPSLVIYWVDTLKLLTYAERKEIEQTGRIISLTPHEVLIEDPSRGRKLAVRKVGDPAAPKVVQ